MDGRKRSVTWWVVGAIAAAAVVAAAWVRLPYYAVGPGPARDVLPMIAFEDHPRYEATGSLSMTTVSARPLTPLTAVAAWIDPDQVVVERDLIYPPGVDEDQEEERSTSQMDESKITATSVVLEQLAEYPQAHGTGALIASTVPGCPADGQLFPGDVVTAIDGRSIADAGLPPSLHPRRGRHDRAGHVRARALPGRG